MESPGPLYLELHTNYKISSRLEYLITAVIDGKGLSQLEFQNESENISGNDDYAQEKEPVADDELDDANSKANTIGGDTFGVDDEDPGPDDSTSHDDGHHSSDEAIFKPTESRAADTAASSLANLPSEATARQDLSNDSTQVERSSPQELSKMRTHGPAVAVDDDDDDIIDYSDQEAAPERSSGSSTVRGDRQEEESGDLPKIGQVLDSDISNDDLTQEHLPGMNSIGASMDHPPQPQGLKADTEDVNGGSPDDQHEHPLFDPANLAEAHDLEDIIDPEDSSENARIAGSIPNENVDTLVDDAVSEVAAEIQKGIGKSAKSTANQNLDDGAHRLPTSEIAFEDDLDYIYEDDTVHDPGITFNPSANDVDHLRLHSGEANGHTSVAQGDDSSGKHTYKEQESSDQQILADDGDEITYDDDDEITIPDQEDPVQKPASTSSNLKRPRDDEHAPNGTLSGQYQGFSPFIIFNCTDLKLEAKRVRST